MPQTELNSRSHCVKVCHSTQQRSLGKIYMIIRRRR